MRIQICTIMVAATILVEGCASTGHEFDTSKVSQIQKEKTTVAELQQWFGKPYSIHDLGGYNEYTWQRTSAAAFVGITKQDVLRVIAVKRDGIVHDYDYRHIGKD